MTAAPALAQMEPVEIRPRCFDCHLNPTPPEGTQSGPYVDFQSFKRSVHGVGRCESCHRSVVDLPHAEHLPSVDCRDCHRADNAVGAPQLKSYREYEESVHGRLVSQNDPRAPRCQNCHGDHDILKPSDPASHVNKFRIAETCGHCHGEIAEAYAGGSHGRQLALGNLEAPVCTDCHGEHSIFRHDDPSSSVSREHVVETCAQCHEDISRMKALGRPSLTVETYRDSYHGIATKFGSSETATCVDCHGHHGITGQMDPRSPVHPANLAATCGQVGCHEGAGAGFAKGRVHVSFHGGEEHGEYTEGRDRSFAKVFRVTELGFIALTTSVIFCMILYMALDLFDRWVRHRRKWFRYLAVTTIPLIATFWAVWKVTLVFVEKLKT
jgi:hypothetical protein